MQPAVEPILRIPLRAEPDGSVWNPQLDIIPAGPTLCIRQPGVQRDWTDAALWHAPSAGAAVLALCLVLLWRAVLRAWARPQSERSVYCRRCNYELTAPSAGFGERGRAAWLVDGARCPE